MGPAGGGESRRLILGEGIRMEGEQGCEQMCSFAKESPWLLCGEPVEGANSGSVVMSKGCCLVAVVILDPSFIIEGESMTKMLQLPLNPGSESWLCHATLSTISETYFPHEMKTWIVIPHDRSES